jgi:hypothetical protein
MYCFIIKNTEFEILVLLAANDFLLVLTVGIDYKIKLKLRLSKDSFSPLKAFVGIRVYALN